MGHLSALDWGVIAGYFLVLLAIVIRAMRRQEDRKDYFLAGRNVGFFAIGASIFASNIGSEHIVGLAGQGASTGWAAGTNFGFLPVRTSPGMRSGGRCPIRTFPGSVS